MDGRNGQAHRRRQNFLEGGGGDKKGHNPVKIFRIIPPFRTWPDFNEHFSSSLNNLLYGVTTLNNHHNKLIFQSVQKFISDSKRFKLD